MDRGFCAVLVLACAVGIAPALADDTGFASSHDLSREAGRLCMASHFHAGSGEGPTKDAAMKAAHKSWYEYTSWEYGSDWAKWSKSGSKDISYAKAEGGWSATIQSRPCR